MKRLVILLGALLYSIAIDVRGNEPAAPDALVRRMARDVLELAELPAVSVAVLVDGRIVFAEAFGYADVETKKRADTSTQFRTASVAKVITATGLGLLVQQGQLDLDAPIQRYVPAFPRQQHALTSRHLAGHISGIDHYSSGDRIERRFYPSVQDALGVFQHKEVISVPGTAYRYSTHGFTLLSAVIEGAAGEPFLEWMSHEVFGPLGMGSTGPDLRARPSEKMSTLYARRDGQTVRIPTPEDPSYKWSSGGMISTPSDLVRMANGYLNGFLKEKTVKLMWTPQKLSSGESTGVGIGWRVSVDDHGRRVIGHAGSMGGARSFVGIFPDDRVAVAFMTNSSWASWVEQTGYSLALPFLARREGIGHSGIYQVEGAFRDQKVRGKLELSAGDGVLAVERADGKGTYRMLVRNLGADSVLVTSLGILRLSLDAQEERIRVRAYATERRLGEVLPHRAPVLDLSGQQ